MVKINESAQQSNCSRCYHTRASHATARESCSCERRKRSYARERASYGVGWSAPGDRTPCAPPRRQLLAFYMRARSTSSLSFFLSFSLSLSLSLRFSRGLSGCHSHSLCVSSQPPHLPPLLSPQPQLAQASASHFQMMVVPPQMTISASILLTNACFTKRLFVYFFL